MKPLLRGTVNKMAWTGALVGQTGIIGYYSLHLYCTFENPEHGLSEFPHEYADEYGYRCRAQARRDGWKLFKDGKAMCPKCTKKKPR